VIAWQNPGAFVALVALAAPIVIHLLQRRRATQRVYRPLAGSTPPDGSHDAETTVASSGAGKAQ